MLEIKDYPDYFVDKLGNVYHKRKGEINKLNPYPRGEDNPQPSICLYNDGIMKQFYVKNIVYETFVEDIPRCGQVICKDGNLSNVAVENLALVINRGYTRPKLKYAVPVQMFRNGEYWGFAETKAQCACIMGISRPSVDNILHSRATFRRCYLEQGTNNNYNLWFNGRVVDTGNVLYYLNKYCITKKVFYKQLAKFNYFQKEWSICT